MLNPNIEEKLGRTIKELESLSVVRQTSLKDLFISSDVDLDNLNCLPKKIVWEKMDNPHIFSKANKYYWIKCSLNIDEPLDSHHKCFLTFDTKIKNVASTIRPQGLLYLNGKIVQGIDINHRDVLIGNGKYDMYVLFYTHEATDLFPFYISTKVVDERINQLFWDLYVPYQSIKILDKKDDDYFKMLPVLEKACNIIDFRNQNSNAFLESIEKCSKFMQENFYKGICGSDLTVNVVGHSHIDVAWLWDYAQTREKAKRTFSTVLKLMDEYPDYKFMSSTPLLYEFIKEDTPELFEQIKNKVKEGRWEVDGVLWLECDCNLTGGESLVRQLYYGKKFFNDEFGVDSKTLWLPDAFGYSGALPQLMKKSGVDRFVTAKIGWNDTNRFPYDTFLWRGIDGSEVKAYLISTPDKCNPREGVYDITYTTYVADMTPNYILGTWHRYSQKDFNNLTFMTMGWGDGGGGVTREMLEAEQRFSYGIPGIPKTRISTLKDTLNEIDLNFEQSCKELNRTPIWTGELYFEFHRGTLTSVPMVKKFNRDSEFLLQNDETLSAINNYLFNRKYNNSLFERNWKKVLLNQFHDVLPGSSIEKVYLDASNIYHDVFNEVSDDYNDNLYLLFNNINAKGIAVYNPNSFIASSDIVVDGKTYIAEDIPPFGYKIISAKKHNNELKISDRSLENKFYRILFGESGAIKSLYDKVNQRELVSKGKELNALVAYEDMPYEYDNWELAYFHKQKPYFLDEPAKFAQNVEDHKISLIIEKKYGKSSIKQEICLYDALERIDIKTSIIWKEQRQILKALFPLNLLVGNIKYDIQYGHVERNCHANNSYDSAHFESVAHKWVDASEHNYGFAVLNNGKYGFGAEENEISISLVKSGSFPYEGASDFVPEFTYSLIPHKGDFAEANIIEKSYVLNKPLIARKVYKHSDKPLSDSYSFVKCHTPGVYIDTIKKSFQNNFVVLRLFEGFKEEKNVKLEFAENISQAFLCDLLENKLEDVQVSNNIVEFKIKPFEVITLGIK